MPSISLASSINQTSTACLTDTEAPKQLDVSLAKFGDVLRPPPAGTNWVRAGERARSRAARSRRWATGATAW